MNNNSNINGTDDINIFHPLESIKQNIILLIVIVHLIFRFSNITISLIIINMYYQILYKINVILIILVISSIPNR